MATNHPDIEGRRKATTPKPERVGEFRRYARGRHKDTLSPHQVRILNMVWGSLFCENICGRILATLRDRLALARFTVDAEGATVAALEAYLKDVWVTNQVPTLAGLVTYATLRDGNHAVTAGWLKTTSRPDGRVTLRRDLWWDGTRGVWVGYDDDGQADVAVREWKGAAGSNVAGLGYRTVYYADRIERFVQSGAAGTWAPRTLPTDPEGTNGVVPWTRDGTADGEPLGIPVVHFANINVPQDPDYQDLTEQPDPNYGASELDGGQIGLQDEVNDLHRDLTAAGRFTAYQIPTITGFSGRKDANGADIPVHVQPGTLMTEQSKEARFGSIPAGDISGLLELLDRKVSAMSNMAQVPTHYINGQWPSGEALLRAERPLVDKVVNIGRSLAPQWGSLMHKAVRIGNTFGRAGLDEGPLIQGLFAAPEQLDAFTLSEIAAKRKDVVSRREQLRLLGYGPAEIARIEAELAEETADATETARLNMEQQRLALQADQARAKAEADLNTPDPNEDPDPEDDTTA